MKKITTIFLNIVGDQLKIKVTESCAHVSNSILSIKVNNGQQVVTFMIFVHRSSRGSVSSYCSMSKGP